MGSFLTTGQVCMAIKRIYVHRSRYQELVDGFSTLAGEYVLGNGLDPEVTMGPLNNERQRDFVRELVNEARQAGAKVTEVGRVRDEATFQNGFFHRPTVITEGEPSLRVFTCEQFGPVMPILAFDDEEQAIQLANDSPYGLCSSVWTAERERALSVARRLEAGYTYLNTHGPMAQDNRAPFGGFKESGIGRNLGYPGLLEYLEYHSISAPAGWLF